MTRAKAQRAPSSKRVINRRFSQIVNSIEHSAKRPDLSFSPFSIFNLRFSILDSHLSRLSTQHSLLSTKFG